jgi:lambda repressor-like predicted transcriptional regulator
MEVNLTIRIKAALILKGITAAEIARKLLIERQTVTQTISGRNKSPRTRRTIAEAIGVDVEELWPGTKDRVWHRRGGRSKRYSQLETNSSHPSSVATCQGPDNENR